MSVFWLFTVRCCSPSPHTKLADRQHTKDTEITHTSNEAPHLLPAPRNWSDPSVHRTGYGANARRLRHDLRFLDRGVVARYGYASFGAAKIGAAISAVAPRKRGCSFAGSGMRGVAAPAAVSAREAIAFVITGASSFQATMISPPM